MSDYLEAMLALVLLAACSSSTDLIDNHTLDCGSPVEVMVGLNTPGVAMEGNFPDRLTLVVEVTNNGHEDFTVKSIRAEQLPNQTVDYQLDNAFRTFNQVVPEGKSKTFELPTGGQPTRSRLDPSRRQQQRGLEVVVTVLLENGDQYRCAFEVQAPI